MATALRLIAEAHRRGLKVVFDMVLNHTSDQHPWFLESRSSRSSPKRESIVPTKALSERRLGSSHDPSSAKSAPRGR